MTKRPKRLCPLGNSLALIIDKPILRYLGLGTRTELRVYLDGQRIVVERLARPAHDPGEAARVAFDSRRRAFFETASVLESSIGPTQMEQLGAGRMLLSRFRAQLQSASNGTSGDLVVMDRIEHVRAAIQARMSLEEAIQYAITAVPDPLPLPRPRKRRARRSSATTNAAPG